MNSPHLQLDGGHLPPPMPADPLHPAAPAKGADKPAPAPAGPATLPDLRQGYASAREVARHHARSFYLASFALFGARRRAAFALYAFCRRLDDLVDTDQPADAPEKLRAARRTVAALFRHEPLPHDGPWPSAELAALQDSVRRFGIPQQPFQDLITGMELDLANQPYRTYAELDRYCYCVAGTVGLLLAPVLGCRDPRGLAFAAELGKAMQLTNILRDVGEDLERGRCYLPLNDLAAFGLRMDDLHARRLDERMVAMLRFQISRARATYARAAQGIPFLLAFGARTMVRLMGALYGGILTAIERQGYDIFRARAYTRPADKLVIVARALLSPVSVRSAA